MDCLEKKKQRIKVSPNHYNEKNVKWPAKADGYATQEICVNAAAIRGMDPREQNI